MKDESIYNIIPRNPETSPKRPLYRSKYPYDIPPTGSTFVHHTTSRPGVTHILFQISNLSGEFNIGLQAHSSRGTSQTLGHLKGARKSSPNNFTRKRTGMMGNNELPSSRYGLYQSSKFFL